MRNLDYIAELLEESDLEGQFDRLPEIIQKAIDKMVTLMRKDNVQRATIRWHVQSDVRHALKEMHYQFLYSFRYLNPSELGTL